MKNTLILTAIAIFTLNGFSQTQKGQDIIGEDEWLFYLGIMADENTVGTLGYDIPSPSIARVFSFDGSNWVQKGQDVSLPNVNFAIITSMPDVNTFCASSGAPYTWGIPNYTWVYTFDGTQWVQKGTTLIVDPSNIANVLWNGVNSSMPDQNTIAISSFEYDSTTDITEGNGLVRVFVWNGTDWVQKGSDIVEESLGDMPFEIEMPDASTVAIGAGYNDGNGTNSGHVRIFEWNGSSWVQKGQDIDGEAAGDQSGELSMPDANTVAIGAGYNDGNGTNSGHVRVFEWNGSSWVQKGQDIDGEAADVYLGNTVSMPDANTFATTGSGTVRIYSWNGSSWVKTSEITGSMPSMPNANTIAVNNSSIIIRVYDLSNTSVNTSESSVFKLSVYPNPTKETLTIELNQISNSGYIITDQLGKVVKEGNLSSQNQDIDVSELSNGLYIIKIGDERRKFVKEY